MGLPRPKKKPPTAEAVPVQVRTMSVRTEDGKFAPGHSGNPAGKKPGTKNLNTHVKDAILQYKAGNKCFLELMLERALVSDPIMEKLMDKLLANATPEQAGGLISSFEAALQSVRAGEGQQPGETRTIAVKAETRPTQRLDTFLDEEEA